MIKRADSARGAPAPLPISCPVASSRSHGRILVAPFPDGNPLVTTSVAAHLTYPIIVRRFWSDRESFASQVSTSRVATHQVFRLRYRPLRIVDRRPHRLRQGHQPPTDRVPPYRRCCCTYSYSASITPRRSAFVVFAHNTIRSLFCHR